MIWFPISSVSYKMDLQQVIQVRQKLNRIEVFFLAPEVHRIQQGSHVSEGLAYMDQQLDIIIAHLSRALPKDQIFNTTFN